MKANPGTTDPAFSTPERMQRYRAQATGVSPCLSESAAQGARRSRQVVDAAPVAQLRVIGPSYPQPAPVCDPLTGKMYDKVTGKAYAPPSEPSVWTR